MKTPVHRRVVLVLPMSIESNRLKLSGIFEYMRTHARWEITVVEAVRTAQDAQRIAAMRPDGIIAAGGYSGRLVRGIPTVQMHRPDADAREPGIHYIYCDNAVVGRTAAAHLLERGFRSFAYLHNAGRSDWSLVRLRGFAERLSQDGHAVQVFPPEGTSKPPDLGKWLLDLPRGTAVFAADDETVVPALASCATYRIEVPDDLAFLGADNDQLICFGFRTPLSSVMIDFASIGRLAAQTLDRLMHGRAAEVESVLTDARVIARESTANGRFAADARVNRALEFIRRNPRKAISVEDVVAHMGVSRRMAEVLFARGNRHTIGEEIRRFRLNDMMRRLRETDESIATICATCGFFSPSHAKRAFKSHFKCTMSEVRKMRPVAQNAT